MLIKLAGLEVEPIYADPRPGDIRHSYADISRAKEILGWIPATPLERGLKLLLESFKAK